MCAARAGTYQSPLRMSPAPIGQTLQRFVAQLNDSTENSLIFGSLGECRAEFGNGDAELGLGKKRTRGPRRSGIVRVIDILMGRMMFLATLRRTRLDIDRINLSGKTKPHRSKTQASQSFR